MPISGALLVAGTLALGALAGRRRRSSGETVPAASITAETATAGWIPWGDPVLEPKHTAFLDALAARLNRRLVVTSGVRTPERQARAMLEKVRLGEDLHKLYDDKLVDELLAVEQTVEAWAAIIRSQMELGFFLSDHLRGDAVDIDDKDASGVPLVRAEVQAAADTLGVEVVFEDTPSHIHFEEIR